MPRIDSSFRSPIGRAPAATNPSSTASASPNAARMATDSAQISVPQSAPLQTDGLTSEEVGLLNQGLLPTNYAVLKAIAASQGAAAAKEFYQKGKTGPFAPQYGDPSDMLSTAKRVARHPELLRLAKSLKKGDIVVMDWNDNNNPVATLTKGPFEHTMICTSDGPPPEFIEAIGITGDQSEPSANRVRRATLGEACYDGLSIRLLRPTEGMAPKAAAEAVDKAVRFTEHQLGKPYDYAFTSKNDAYYCSELAYEAYASPSGAGMAIHLDKNANRDSMIVALDTVVNSLQPTDKTAMLTKTLEYFTSTQHPSASQLMGFLVDNILSTCKTTEDISKTPAQKANLKNTLTLLMEGKAFPRFQDAKKAFDRAEKNHEFDAPIVGAEKRLQMQMAIETGLTADCAHLFGTSGVDYVQAMRATTHLLGALLPYSETFADYLYGPRDPRSKAIGSLLDDLAWVKDHAPHLPLVGDFGLHNLPTRAKPQIQSDFVSPADLAWADVPHYDFNVKPGGSLDDPARKQAASR